ncbi:MAG: hypothetical protein HC904_01925 [Blastochloris sp.]|nr:hypothetical protein [Blastochloris sp.]
MTEEEFHHSLLLTAPPETLTLPLQALWWEAKGDWELSHRLAQEAQSREGDWVHAYLHRKEGDEGNASYWYQRAGRQMQVGSLDQEWSDMVGELLLLQS